MAYDPDLDLILCRHGQRKPWARQFRGSTGKDNLYVCSILAMRGATVALSPGPGRAHNWPPMSFNPMTGLVYIPTTTASSSTFAAQPAYEPQPTRPDGFTGLVFPPQKATRPSPPAIGPEPPAEPGAAADTPPPRLLTFALDTPPSEHQHAFQACSFNHSDISPCKWNQQFTGGRRPAHRRL